MNSEASVRSFELQFRGKALASDMNNKRDLDRSFELQFQGQHCYGQ